MIQISKTFLLDIEFHRILQFLQEKALGSRVGKQFEQLLFFDLAESIQHEMNLVSKFREFQSLDLDIDLAPYSDLTSILEHLNIENYALEIQEIQAIKEITSQCTKFIAAIDKVEEEFRPLKSITQDGLLAKTISETIQNVIDENDEVRSSASDELKAIRNELSRKTNALDGLFNQSLRQFKQANYLADPPESIRGGRRVLCVKAEFKRKVSGIIHDLSASNQTVFIEPEQLVEVHNLLFELRNEEHKEIYRIRKVLSAQLNAYRESIADYEHFIQTIDRLRAKALLADTIDAHQPALQDDPVFDFIEARHPILLLNHQKQPNAVVPFNLQLFAKNKILVISGPNAGGKTITLKAVGLLQCMVQYGLLVPAGPESTFGVFRRFFADIGDHQSVDQGLSTYSSHLKKMTEISEKADNQTLILIDELGSGTDPKIGGAIAQAILENLNKKGVFGIISTHYSNLKTFAHKTKGIVNASMQFDQEQLKPTYQLRVGKPGSSFAFQVAEKSGLHSKIIRRAKQLSGGQQQNFESLISKLEREKQELEQELGRTKEQQKKLQKLIKNYEQLQFDLTVKKKKLRLEQKIRERNEVAQANKDLEKLIRDLREEQNLKKAKKLAQQIKSTKKQLEQDILEARNNTPTKKKNQNRPFEEGDYVKTSMGLTGKILSIRKDKVQIQAGGLLIDAKAHELEFANAPIETNPNRAISTTLQNTSKVYRKIDIIGLNKQEAMKRLEKFFDDAVIANLRQLEVVHGLGSGTLRKAVIEKLDEYSFDYEVSHPKPEAGGEGLSIVKILD